MRVGLISDTHIPETRPGLPKEIFDVFHDVDLVLHGGDMYVIDVLDWLEQGLSVPIVAVRGNGDGRSDHPPFPANDPRVKGVQTLDLEGVRVGMVHAIPFPHEVRTEHFDRVVKETFGEQAIDVVVCGDTHIPRVDLYQEMLLVNSGSPTIHDLRKRLGTVAILTIECGKASATMIELSGV
ncbi:MAG: YfcE family phosphodiesterase [Dehalococcoidia bacterium]|nr:YfcE family phosphodiesterase [Dehalococcoidia bacterium]